VAEAVDRFITDLFVTPQVWSFFGSEEDRRRCAEAEKRSYDLLRSWLTPEQLADFNETDTFICRGSDTGERYRIDNKLPTFNVILLDDSDKDVQRFCFLPQGETLPRGDVLLTQKFYIEKDELKARCRSNRITPNGAGYAFG
jgi:hypothetical protein